MPGPQLAMGDQRKGSGDVCRAKSMPLSLLERGTENRDSCSRSPSPSTERCPSILPSESVRRQSPLRTSSAQLPPSFLRPGSDCVPPQPSSLWSRGKLTTAKEMEGKLAFPSVGCWGPFNPMGVVCRCYSVPFPKCMTHNSK